MAVAAVPAAVCRCRLAVPALSWCGEVYLGGILTIRKGFSFDATAGSE